MLVFNTAGLGTETKSVTVDRVAVIDVPAGPYLRLELHRLDADDPVSLTVAGQKLEGEFGIEVYTKTVGAISTQIVRIVATGIRMEFGPAGNPFVTLTNGEGFVIVTPDATGVLLAANASLSVPGVAMSAELEIRINTGATSFDEQFTLGARTVHLVLDPGVMLKGRNITFDSNGVQLSADVEFTHTASTTTVTVENASMSIGAGGVTYATVDNGTGSFTIVRSGTAVTFTASLSAHVEVTVPGVTVTANPFTVDFDSVSGFRISAGGSGSAATVSVLGQTLSGVFSVEVQTSIAGVRRTVIAFEDVTLDFGPIQFVNDANDPLAGLLVITPDGIVAMLNVDVIFSGFTGGVAIQVNTTNQAFSATFGTNNVSVAGGPFLQVEGSDVHLSFGGQTLDIGHALFQKAGTVVTLTASGVSARLGDPSGVYLSLTNGAGSLTIVTGGAYGFVSGLVELHGVDGVVLRASMEIHFDTRTGAPSLAGVSLLVRGSVQVSVTVPGTGSAGALPAVQLSGDVEVTFAAAPVPSNQPVITVSATHVSTFIGLPGVLGFSITNGLLDMRLFDTGPAVYVSGTVQVTGGGLDLSGNFALRANLSGNTLDLGGITGVADGTIDLSVNSAVIRGPPVGEITVASLSFKRLGSGEIVAGATGVAFELGTEDTSISVTGASFALYLKTDGTHAFRVSGTVNVTLAAKVTIAGTLTVERNTTGVAVDQVIPNQATHLIVAAGVTKIEGTNGTDPFITVTPVSGQPPLASLAGTFTIQISGAGPDGLMGTADDADEVLVAATGISLQLGPSGGPTLTVSGGQLFLVVVGGNVALDVRGDVALTGLTDVAVSGRVGVQFSSFTDRIVREASVGSETLTIDLPANVTRFGGTGVSITVAPGQTLTATFDAEVLGSEIHIAITDASFALGDGNRNFLSVTGAHGTIDISATTLDVDLTGAVAVDIPGVTFGGNVTVDIVVTEGGDPGDHIDVVVDATTTGIVIAGQTLKGTFSFSKSGTTVRISGEHVALELGGDPLVDGDGLVEVSNGDATFLILPTGVAGRITGDITVDAIPGLTFTDVEFAVLINTTPTEVELDSSTTLPAGPYLRVEVSADAGEIELDVGGVTLSASGTLAIEQQTRADGPVTIVAFLDVAFSLSVGDFDGAVSNVTGLIVVLPTGVAGVLTGDFVGDVGPAHVEASVSIRFNTTPTAVAEMVTLDGRQLTISFGAAETTDYFAVSLSGASLKIGDFVTIEGDVAFSTGSPRTFAGTNLKVFLGRGPATLENDEINPLAVGLLLTNATVGVVEGTTAGTYAVFATGTLQLIGIAGVTVIGTATVRFNNTGANVNVLLTIAGSDDDVLVDVPDVATAGVDTAIFQAVGLEISVMGQTLRGDFTFTKSASDPGRIVVTASNVEIDLGGAVRFSGGTGTIVITAAGVAADVSGDISINLPGVSFDGDFALTINTTGAAVNEGTFHVDAGPYLKVVGGTVSPIELTIAGQTLSGSFTIERVTDASGATITRIAVSDVTLELGGDPTVDGDGIVTASDGEGTFLITPAGIAGQLSVHLAVASGLSAGFSFNGTFSLAINTLPVAVNEQFRVAGHDFSLALPAGPYLRVEGTNVTLTIGVGDAVSLTGNVSFEQISVSNPATGVAGAQPVVRVGLSNVQLTLGGSLLRLTNGSGSILLTSAGVAASFSADVSVSIPNVSFGGSLTVEINRTSADVNETFVVGGVSQVLALPAGPFTRVVGRGISVDIFGQRLSGDFTFEQQASGKVKVSAANVSLSLGNGLLTVSNGSARLVLTPASTDGTVPAGIAGTIDIGAIALNVPGVVLNAGTGSGSALTIELNTTGAEVNEPFGSGTLHADAGTFVRVIVRGASLTIAGQQLALDVLQIEQVQLGPTEKIVTIALVDSDDIDPVETGPVAASLTLADGLVDVTLASGLLILGPTGVVASFTGGVHFHLPGLTFNVTSATFEINTTPAAVDRTFVIDGQALPLHLPAGSFLRLALDDVQVTLNAGGLSVQLTADFAFEQRRNAAGQAIVVVGIADGSLSIDIGGQGASLTAVTGAFVVIPNDPGNPPTTPANPGGIAGVLSGHAVIGISPAEVEADAILRINNSGDAVDESILVGGRSITVRFGPDEGNVFSASATNARITIGDFVTIEGDVSFDGDAFSGQNLEIFLGQGPARLENGDINPLAVGVLLTNARIGLVKVGTEYALHAEGTVMLLGINGVTIVGTAVIDVNTTGTVIDRSLSIAGSSDGPVVVRFATPGRVTNFVATNVELSVLGQTIRGNFSFDRDPTTGVISIGVDNVSLQLGGAGAGILIDHGTGGILVTPTGIAADISGDVHFTLPAVQFDGDFRIAINTTSTVVDTAITVGDTTIVLDLAAGPYLRIEGKGVELTIADQTLSGNFVFERITSTGGAVVTTIAASNVRLSITAGTTEIVALTNGTGLFVVDATGIGGRLSGDIAVNIPGGAVSISGSFVVEINSTNHRVQASVVVGGQVQNLDIALGAKVRVSGTGVTIAIAGQIVTADVLFQQIETQGGVSAIRIGIANLNMSFAGGLVTVSNGTGAMFLTSTGTGQSSIAARLSATIGVSIPGVSFTGTLGIVINTGAAVSETFMVGTTSVSLVIPQAGPFFEVSGTGIALDIAGQRISGDFAVRQTTDTTTGAKTTTITVTNGSISLGGDTPVVQVTAVNGSVLVTPTGVAASLSASVAVTIPGVQFSGSFKVDINTTTTSQTVRSGIQDVVLPAGPYLRVAGDNVNLTIAGQTLHGAFTFEKATRADGTAVVRVAAADVGISLGGVLDVTNGSGFFVVTPNGIAGSLSASVALRNIPGVSFSGSFAIAVNNTANEVHESIQVGTNTITLDLPAGPYLRVEGTNIQLTIAGQRLSGNVAFEQLTLSGRAVVRVALSNVRLSIGDGTNELVTVSNGQGSLIVYGVTPTVTGDKEGIAGSFSGSVALNIPGVTLSASVRVDINQISPATEVHETFVVGGQTIHLDLDDDGSPYVRLEVTGAVLAFSGLTLTGDFTFKQGGTAPNSYLEITLTDVELVVAGGCSRVANVDGFIRSRAGVLQASLSGDVELDVPGVNLDGSFTIGINTSTTDEFLPPGGTAGQDEIPVNSLRIKGEAIHLEIAGVTIDVGVLTIDKTFGASGSLSIGIENANASIGPLGVDDVHGSITITPTGIYGVLTIDSVTLVIPGVTPTITNVRLRVNTTTAAQNVGTPNELPAGPFIEVGATVSLLITALPTAHFEGTFLFRQSTRAAGQTITVIAVSGLTASIDGQGLTDGSGALILLPGGIAGVVSGRIDVSVGSGTSASGGATLRINQSGEFVDETIEIGGESIPVLFNDPDGDGDPNEFSVQLADVNIVLFDFVYVYDADISGPGDGTTVITGATLFIGEGPYRLDNGTPSDPADDTVNPVARGVVVTGVGFTYDRNAGTFHAEGVVSVIGFPGVVFTGGVVVDVNGTSKTITIGTSADPAILEVAGQRLEGQFTIAQHINAVTGASSLSISMTGVSIHLGGGVVSITDVTTNDGTQDVPIQLTPSGVLAQIRGHIDIDLPGVAFEGDVQVLLNSHTTPQTLGTFVMNPGISVRATGVTLTVAGQTIAGDFAFEQVTLPLSPQALPGTTPPTAVRIVANNVKVEIGGDGDPTVLDGVVTLDSGVGFFLLLDGGVAGRIGGTVHINIPGLDASQFSFTGTFGLAVNTTSEDVSEQFVLNGQTITLDVPAGPFFRVTGTNVTLRILGQRLSGNFGFEQITESCGQPTCDSLIRIVADHVELALGDGTTNFVRLTNGSAFIVVRTAGQGGSTTGGLAGRIQGTINVDLPIPVGLSGTFAIEINTTGAAVDESFDLGGAPIQLELPTGNYVRIGGTNIQFTIAGQTLAIDTFVFEQLTTNTGERIVTIALLDSDDPGTTAASISLAGVVQVNITRGILVLTPGGIAGELTAGIALVGITGLTFNVTATVTINNGQAAVRRTVNLPTGGTETIDVEAGPYLRVEASGDIQFSGLTLNGTFVFEQSTTESGARVVKIGLSDVNLSLGGGVVTVGNGQGVIILLPAQFGVTINTVSDADITVDSASQLTVGMQVRYVRDGTGPAITGLTSGTTYYVKTVSGSTITLSATPGGIALGNLVLTPTTGTTHTFRAVTGAAIGAGLAGTGGIAGTISADVGIDIPGVNFAGSFALQINTTKSAVNDTLTVGGTPLTIDVPAGPYIRVEGTGVTLSIAGVTLAGNFAFEQTTQGTVIVASDVSLNLGGGMLELFDGEGIIFIRTADNGPASGGLIASISISIRAHFGDAVSLGGKVTLKINQTNVDVSGTNALSFTIAGRTKPLDVAAGPALLRVVVEGATAGQKAFLEIAGQRLEADRFEFVQQTLAGVDTTLGTADDVKNLRVSALGVSLNLGGGIVVIDQGTLDLEITAAGLAAVISAHVVVDVASVLHLETSVTVKINQRRDRGRDRLRHLAGGPVPAGRARRRRLQPARSGLHNRRRPGHRAEHDGKRPAGPEGRDHLRRGGLRRHRQAEERPRPHPHEGGCRGDGHHASDSGDVRGVDHGDARLRRPRGRCLLVHRHLQADRQQRPDGGRRVVRRRRSGTASPGTGRAGFPARGGHRCSR